MADDAATRTTLGDLRDGQLHAQHFIRGSVQSKFHLERKDGEDTLRFYLREESTAGVCASRASPPPPPSPRCFAARFSAGSPHVVGAAPG